MNKKILVVEDDSFFRATVRDLLAKNYIIIEAQDGRQAKELILNEAPNLVITDIQMPHFSGIELLEWIKQEELNVPVMLMTGFSQILETTKAHELGASEFLAKPFKESEFVDKIHRLLGENTNDFLKKRPHEKDYCKIPIEDFVTEKNTEFGIYIKVAEHKFIKIAHKGGKISEDKIKSFKDKGLQFLYVRKEDFSRIVEFSIDLSKTLSDSDGIDDAKKARFLQYTGSLIIQEAFINGTDEKKFKHAKQFLDTSLDFILENPQTYKLLEQLSEHTDYIYAHSLCVSIYSVMIAKELQITSAKSLFNLSLAGLFHDIGLKEIPEEILNKPRPSLSQIERSLFESHCARGRDILESIQLFPREVTQLVYEHHENLLGTGYPERIDQTKIQALSRILIVANTFCNLTIKSPSRVTIYNPLASLEIMRTDKKNTLDQKAVESLSRIIVKR